MTNYTIRQIQPEDFAAIRELDRAAFENNKGQSDGDFHEVFADNIRRSPYYIPQLDLIAVAPNGIFLGHAIFSKLPMGDQGEHIILLHSLAVNHGQTDSYSANSFEFQRKGIGTALTLRGLEIAKTLGYTGCMTCGHPAVYREKMGFLDYRDLNISKDESVEDLDIAIHAIELVPGGFDKTNRLLSYSYYDFSINEQGFDPEKLKEALTNMFGKKFIRAVSQTRQLQGGTLGDVRLVFGTAHTTEAEELPYKVVCKRQKKWERYGDADSWRREYDLYVSGFGDLFEGGLRWPKCYYAELKGDEWQIWMEYIEGYTGADLMPEMFERAAEELGRFQGRLYAEQPHVLNELHNLSDLKAMRNFYEYYKNLNGHYDYIRSEACALPQHLCQMIIETDRKAEEIWARVERLPVVFCHRDFWITNIFYKDKSKGKDIVLIDWDTCGWGYLGEDILSLVADEAPVERMIDYYMRCVPAYLRGFAQYGDVPQVNELFMRERIILRYGYRLIDWFLTAKKEERKLLHLNTLQKIYEMGDIDD